MNLNRRVLRHSKIYSPAARIMAIALSINFCAALLGLGYVGYCHYAYWHAIMSPLPLLVKYLILVSTIPASFGLTQILNLCSDYIEDIAIELTRTTTNPRGAQSLKLPKPCLQYKTKPLLPYCWLTWLICAHSKNTDPDAQTTNPTALTGWANSTCPKMQKTVHSHGFFRSSSMIPSPRRIFDAPLSAIMSARHHPWPPLYSFMYSTILLKPCQETHNNIQKQRKFNYKNCLIRRYK